MGVALHACLNSALFSGRQRRELLGRLSFTRKRFQLDLMPLQVEGLFTPRGAELFHECGRVFDGIYQDAQRELVSLDFTNQAYVFSFRRFQERNPVEGIEGLEDRRERRSKRAPRTR